MRPTTRMRRCGSTGPGWRAAARIGLSSRSGTGARMSDTHLLEASLEKKAQPALRLSWLLPLIVLVLGLAMTVAAWREAHLVAHQEIQRDFDYQVRRITHLLQQ